ncbi:MAG: ribosome maturation factor RimP [Acidimicrobiales bacterium]
MSIPDTVMELLAPVVANLDAELIDVDHNGDVLRLVVDREGGIDIDTLATINRVVSPMLDDHDPISGRYTLEVSSPGVERKLRRPRHFERAVGEQVIVKLMPGGDVRRLKGELVAAADDTIDIDVTDIDGTPVPADHRPDRRTVSLDEISSARTVFDWGPAPKPGKGTKPGSGKKKSGKKSQAGAPSKHSTNDKQGARTEAHSEGEAP